MRWQDYIWLILLSGSFLLFYIFNRKSKKSRKPKPRSERPLTRREQKAWRKLEESGYRLVEIHPALPVIMSVDGKQKSFFHEADFIVSRGGKSFLVKTVKGQAPLNWNALRRELLLDYLFYQTDGIFFYREDKGQLQEIDFAFQSGPGPRSRFIGKAALIVLIALGAIYLGYLVISGGYL